MSGKTPQPWDCNHANEVPNVCPCQADCYCRLEGSCKAYLHGAAAPPHPVANFINLHAVMAVNDDGFHQGVQAYFSDPLLATQYAKGKGAWGADAPITDVVAVHLPGHGVYALKNKNPIDVNLKGANYREQVKKEALAKLTPAERQALGL